MYHELFSGLYGSQYNIGFLVESSRAINANLTRIEFQVAGRAWYETIGGDVS